MGKLIIKRESSMLGSMAKINCYVDDRLVCSLKNGEEQVCDVYSDRFEFKCSLSTNANSYIVPINMAGHNVAKLFLKQGVSQIRIMCEDETIIATNMQKTKNRDSIPSVQFTATKSVGSLFAIDENAKLWAVGDGGAMSFKDTVPHKFSDVISFELLEDDTSIINGGLGRAAIGGLLFGSTGAIVGSVTGSKKVNQKCKNMTVKITVNYFNSPNIYIKLLSYQVDKNSGVYKTAFKNAQEIISLLQIITANKQESQNGTAMPGSPTEEIRKYKQLLDDGIISTDEFEAKKKQILSL